MSDALAPRPEPGATSLLDEPSPNGHVAEPFEAKLLADLEGAITEKREAVTALEVERAAAVERIDAQLATQRAALKRYEDTRKRLVGEPLRGAYKKPGPKPQGERVRAVPSNPSPERLQAVREAIVRYAEEHDEFAQVDIRSLPDAPITHSGGIAHAFELLRQEGFIRFARQDGLRKLYRLPRSAVAEK